MPKAILKAIRLLILDDHALFREGVSRLLQAEAGLEVVAHCGSITEALRALKSDGAIDVVLLDLDLGQERGTELLQHLQRAQFAGKVLLVTADVSENEIPQLIRKGIGGIFLKHGSPASLIQGIRDIADGKALFDQEMLRRAFDENSVAKADQGRANLTERERQVLAFVFEGQGNKQIAARLQISETAVKASLQQLFAKTGVRTRGQLVRVALEQYRDQL
jgi:two-component system, NarL family, nitrate/nitrite response regulator NarL